MKHKLVVSLGLTFSLLLTGCSVSVNKAKEETKEEREVTSTYKIGTEKKMIQRAINLANEMERSSQPPYELENVVVAADSFQGRPSMNGETVTVNFSGVKNGLPFYNHTYKATNVKPEYKKLDKKPLFTIGDTDYFVGEPKNWEDQKVIAWEKDGLFYEAYESFGSEEISDELIALVKTIEFSDTKGLDLTYADVKFPTSVPIENPELKLTVSIGSGSAFENGVSMGFIFHYLNEKEKKYILLNVNKEETNDLIPDMEETLELDNGMTIDYMFNSDREEIHASWLDTSTGLVYYAKFGEYKEFNQEPVEELFTSLQ